MWTLKVVEMQNKVKDQIIWLFFSYTTRNKSNFVSTSIAIPDNSLYQGKKWVRFKYPAVYKNIWNHKAVFVCVLFERGNALSDRVGFCGPSLFYRAPRLGGSGEGSPVASEAGQITAVSRSLRAGGVSFRKDNRKFIFFHFIFTQFSPLVLKVIRGVSRNKDMHGTLCSTLICKLHFISLFIQSPIHIVKRLCLNATCRMIKSLIFIAFSFLYNHKSYFVFILC